MDVQIACCNSTIENASRQQLEIVRRGLAEIIDSSTAMLEADFPGAGGLAGLRAALLADGAQQLEAQLD